MAAIRQSAQRREHLQEVVDRHRQAVYAYFRPRVLQTGDAEDLSQEVFVRYFEASRSFDCPNDQRRWLIGIARNVFKEHVRKAHGRREVAWCELCLTLDQVSRHDADRDAEYVRHLPACLEELGPSARRALEWHYRDRLSIRAIAARLNRSEGAVKLLMFRARQALKQRLECRIRQSASRNSAKAASQERAVRRNQALPGLCLSPVG